MTFTRTTRRVQLRAVSVCVYGVVLMVSAFAAYWAMFSQYRLYDDEGYHLWVLRLFAAGHPLYNGVFSYYGPFPYELWGGLSALTGVTFSTNTGRVITLVLWLGTSLLLAITTKRLTGRLGLAVIVQVVSFSVLTAIEYEPMYPGSTALVLVCGILVAAVFLLRSRPRVAATAIGALVGAVLSSKINVGGYAAISVAYAVVMSMPRLPWQMIARAAAIATIVLVGPAVMATTLNTGWTQRYAFLVAASAVALVLVTAKVDARADASSDAKRWAIWMLGGLAGALALVIGVSLATGTTPRALFDSVVITASHQANVFDIPVPLGTGVFYWPTAAVAVAWLVRRAPPVIAARLELTAVLRVLAGLAIWYSVANPLHIGPAAPQYPLALSLIWVAAVPSTRDDGSLESRFVRLLVPALALLQALIAYPVAGTQFAFGSVLFVVCGAVCVADGWSDLQTASRNQPLRSATSRAGTILAALTAVLALVYAIQYVVRPARIARRSYNVQQALPFHGATYLRLPREQVTEFANMVDKLRAECRSLITMPGMMSLNLWSGLPAPSGMAQEPWWAVLSPAQLQTALTAARAAHGLCLVRNDLLVGVWLAGRQLPQIPLVKFVENDFAQVGQFGPYTVNVRITAATPPVVTYVSPPNGSSDVSAGARPFAAFNQNMAYPSTVAFSLVRAGDRHPVAGRVIIFGGRALVFLPATPLAPGARYIAKISTAAISQAGNHLRDAKTWSFTTRPRLTIFRAALNDTAIAVTADRGEIRRWADGRCAGRSSATSKIAGRLRPALPGPRGLDGQGRREALRSGTTSRPELAEFV